VSVNWLAYLEYFLIISLPTLIFILGLSFFVMSILKNQAITFIILLGYVAVTIFYLNTKFYYLFDYMAYSMPLLNSDFIGFGNLPASAKSVQQQDHHISGADIFCSRYLAR